MKQPKQLVHDMIGHNDRMECIQCGKTLHIPEAQFCSMRCEKLHRANKRLEEGLRRLPNVQ